MSYKFYVVMSSYLLKNTLYYLKKHREIQENNRVNLSVFR